MECELELFALNWPTLAIVVNVVVDVALKFRVSYKCCAECIANVRSALSGPDPGSSLEGLLEVAWRSG